MTEAIEFVDRNRDRAIVQMDQFKKVESAEELVPGKKFVVPEGEDGRIGLLDGKTMKPRLLTVKNVYEVHVTYYEFDTNKKSNRAVAWDLCYVLMEE